jgi:hypothetical protein
MACVLAAEKQTSDIEGQIADLVTKLSEVENAQSLYHS